MTKRFNKGKIIKKKKKKLLFFGKFEKLENF